MAEDFTSENTSTEATDQASGGAEQSADYSLQGSLQAKTEGQGLLGDSEETEGQETGARDGEEPERDKQPKGTEKETVEKPKLDPELQKFFTDKGLDIPEELATNDHVQKLADMYRNLESMSSKKQSEYESKLREIEAAQRRKEADDVVNSESDKEDLSPLDTVEQQYEQALDYQLSVLGVENLEDLREQYPQVYENFRASFQQAKDRAYREMFKWEKQRETKQAEQRELEQKLKTEWDQAKSTVAENLQAAAKEIPNIQEVFADSGVNKHLTYMSETTGVPVEFFLADKQTFDFFSNVAKMHDFVKNIDKRDSKLRQSWEKELLNAKQAEMPSASDTLPDEHRALQGRRLGAGVSLLE